ncbi:MAG: hypothetical protein WAV90_22155 [Gordonia amarae]
MSDFCDFSGRAIAVGDTVCAVAWDGLPLALLQGTATVVGFGKTRVRVRFSGEAYGGQWPEYRAVRPALLRVVDKSA